MNTDISRKSANHRFALWSVFLLMGLIIAGLATLNVLTLASATWHDKAYEQLSAVLSHPFFTKTTEGRSSKWLNDSKNNRMKAEVEEQTRQMRKEVADMRTTAIATQLALAGARQTIKSLEKDKVVIGQDRDAYRSKHDRVAAEHAAFKERAGRMARSYAGRTAQAVSRRLAGAAGQVVPFAGATVTAAFLAMDVQEAWQSVRDFESLSGPDVATQSWISAVCKKTPTASDLILQVKTGWHQAYTAAVAYLPDRPQLSVSERTMTNLLQAMPW